MGKNRGNPPMKEIEHAIIHAPKSDTQLVNTIPQVICFRAPQFVAHISQPLDAYPALILRFGWDPVQPSEHGNGLRVLSVEDNSNLGHDTSLVCSHYCEHWSRGEA